MDTVNGADCVIIAVAHKQFKELGLGGLEQLYRNDTRVLIDVKGIYLIEELKNRNYIWWRL